MPESERSPARIRLVALSPSDFAQYMASLEEEYARDHVRAGQWGAAEALDRARRETHELLPQGMESPDHYFRTIVADPVGTAVGRLWFAVRRGEGPPFLFVYDLLVFEKHRGHGYGEAAMRALEPVARELQMPRIALHVFGHNPTAVRLYERIGYRPTNLLMSKPVDGPSTSPR